MTLPWKIFFIQEFYWVIFKGIRFEDMTGSVLLFWHSNFRILLILRTRLESSTGGVKSSIQMRQFFSCYFFIDFQAQLVFWQIHGKQSHLLQWIPNFISKSLLFHWPNPYIFLHDNSWLFRTIQRSFCFIRFFGQFNSLFSCKWDTNILEGQMFINFWLDQKILKMFVDFHDPIGGHWKTSIEGKILPKFYWGNSLFFSWLCWSIHHTSFKVSRSKIGDFWHNLNFLTNFDNNIFFEAVSNSPHNQVSLHLIK